ncbi:hypothetical protein ACF07T_41250 [Streptomyces sp. NPDC015184]|uniref:hypothetical protein n=1 Tax=Streptomyces sp. NPDC015184 TaxID=3364946 RepID=UPI0036FA7DC3
MTEALASAGQYEDAAVAAQDITDPGVRARALVSAAEALTEAGLYKGATAIARDVTDPHRRASLLVSVVRALAEAGRGEDAVALANEAATAARSLTDPGDHARALASVAKALAAAHQRGPAIFSGQTTVLAVEHPNPVMVQGRRFLADALNSPVWSPDIADAVLSVEPDCSAAFLTRIVTGRHERDYTEAGSTPPATFP